ncbi:P-loop containing nucleoside triphosphate hydrolase protein [Dendrothele bispora CBS 962.96]|uniref:Guanine nucleotide-binding protein-like 1 n=1 Tax=Dendrothele bispora (strain CBS 962.96) TaxID=1314807 RepID=A0A4S8MXR3_DENBC|nr:P-loop containing nucleoside triphosphate hydrolase protein [Dendrothele bispora CBS 962.96]
MPRKKPTSTRKKKEEQQLKRAVKRGDAPPPPKKPQHSKKYLAARSGPSAASDSSRKLQSSFIKLSADYLDKTKALASNTPLIRPIPSNAILLPMHVTDQGPLTCLRRPKWRFEMSKKEVERNEEGVFKKWMKQMDEIVDQWQNNDNHPSTPPSPTYFERNLEVWRQLWRVTEMSQIVLVLLDARCPLLHYPPSLSHYLADRKVILVLTKTDIPRASQVEAWASFFRNHYPNSPIVRVKSYASKEPQSVQGHTSYEPHIPQELKEQLVAAIRLLHSELIEPPEKVKVNPAWLDKWKPSVPTDIDWEAALDSEPTIQYKSLKHSEEEIEASHQPQILTIGLIGQPNTGKSSLLNALLGMTKVRASKTPGKTKHFQTLFWTPRIRLVDCPGLVFPNFVPMEMQVLSGILPIARMSAFSACIHFASSLLPLEKILNLTHPTTSEEPVVDKRTWRDGMKPTAKQTVDWKAMDILTAYATQRSWFTAKAGRPDVARAANACNVEFPVLRALAEGRIPWAFWPPDTSPEYNDSEPGMGISLVQDVARDDFDDGYSDEETTLDDNIDDGDDVSSDGDDDSDADLSDGSTAVGTLGRFALLKINDDDGDDDEVYDDVDAQDTLVPGP